MRPTAHQGLGLFVRMKSTFVAIVFGITGAAAILLAVPAEDGASVIKIHPPKSFPDYGDPVVPQIEEVPPPEELLPKPLDHYSMGQADPKKSNSLHHPRVVRQRPNFLQKLFASFIKLQKKEPAKSVCKRSVHHRREAE